MRTKKYCYSLLAGLALVTGASFSWAEVIPVVSTDNAVSSLQQYELINIFLGKTRRLPDGSLVVPIDQVEGSKPRDDFYKTFANMSAAQLKSYWSKIIFTGRGRPPETLKSGSEIKQWLTNHPKGIGYIERELLDDSLKELQVE